MISKIEQTISKIKSGRLTIGGWVQIVEPCIGKILSACGFDWVAVDLEHGTYNHKYLPAAFEAIHANDCLALARLADNSEVAAKLALDAGADGIIVPMINSKEDALRAVAAAKYPPEGTRGVGFSNASNFGKDFSSYFKSWNKRVVLIVQIEHIDGVKHLHDILTVDGVDGLLVGPYDLTGSMNITGNFDHPEFVKVMDKIKQTAQSTNKLLGVHIVPPDTAKAINKIKEGYNLIAYSIDTVVLWSHFSEAIREIKRNTE